MPYELQSAGDDTYYVVAQDTGAKQNRRPLSRTRALALMKALYANVPEARTKAAVHTGVMIALFVPPAALPAVTALQEGLPNPEPADDLHLTLAYLGDSAELAPYAALIDEVLASMYWGDLPLTGRIGGIGRFYHDEGNGTNAVYASFDSPTLPQLRQSIVEALLSRRIPVVQNHGFTPHITLAYVPIETDIPTTPRDMPDLTFPVFTLAWGDTRIEYGPGSNVDKIGAGLATKDAPITVFKDAAGHYRWLTFSSTAFRDRDDEIVSTKALEDDVARADADGDYGPLRWWHLPGLDIGDCDFNAMHGRTLIESGTFRDERYGPLIAAKAADLGVSIGFHHPATEPDAEKVFHRIRRFERSLLPLAYPSNLYTALVVKENAAVDDKKIEGLKALGFDDDMIASIQQQATAREKAADAAGVAFKEAPPEAPVETPVETPAAAPVFFGDMTLEDAQRWIEQRNQPLLDAIAKLTGATATKEQREQETQVALKATQDAISGLREALKADREAVDAKLGQALKSIAELQGDVPAGIKRASQDAATVATKEQVDAFKGPAADPMNDFLTFVAGAPAG